MLPLKLKQLLSSVSKDLRRDGGRPNMQTWRIPNFLEICCWSQIHNDDLFLIRFVLVHVQSFR